jgi:glycerol-3-phosphate cytidylyltransferase-like family protein
MIITWEKKTKDKLDTIEKIKKNIIFLYPIISSEEKERLENIFQKYDNDLQTYL